ncbi:conserved Plasmodium protein, unknown function [Plasmodium gallinaceum]|uniref:Uncharacterized protein n=1 Tax=Plasmodium gallinaceum TaxID=5849 RepID=A0A1J1GZ91_PLAGA|nr:conserved Plasmodium protein, unknown function [Plasmodium gallinaceum]CRG97553.1 conserved Plasmodium protein, unknown function [Plasmodium gallinaceum]
MKHFIFVFFFLFYLVYAQIPYDILSIYKPLNSQSVKVLPGDKVSIDYKLKDIKDDIGKEYSENSLKKLAEKYYKDVDSTDQNILEELDQLKDLLGEKSLFLTIF